MYVELLTFEMEVINILETKTYEFTDKANVQVIKSWPGQEGLELIKTFMNKEKESAEQQKDLFQS